VIILDTNVISELIRREPAAAVLERVRSFSSDEIHTTVITEAEIRLGLSILPRRRKRATLQVQVELILNQVFAGRILPFDSAAARAYAAVVAASRTAGRPISLFDAQIAAIVQVHRAVLVTRNERDFQDCGFEVINPWGIVS